MEALKNYYEEQLLNGVIPFWENRLVDQQCGGYFNCFDKSGDLYSDVKSGWFVGRNIYLFSTLYNNISKDQKWLDIANVGVEFLIKKIYAGNGRFNLLVDRKGQIIEGTTSIHTDHFAAKGLIEYIVASGDYSYKDFVKEILDTLFENAEDRNLMESEGVPSGYLKHSVNFMSLLVAMETKKLFGDEYKDKIDKYLNRCLYTFTDDSERATFEYVNIQENSDREGIGRLVDIGHAFESLCFCMQEGIYRQDSLIIERAEKALDWIIKRGYDQKHGGFYELVDVYDHKPEEKFMESQYDGTAVKYDDKIWWVQVEALYALALSGVTCDNKTHFDYFNKMHNYCKEKFVDTNDCEWYSILDRNNSIKDSRKGSLTKGPYHIPRAYMNLILLFDNKKQ